MPREATCAYLEQIPEYHDSVNVIDVLNLAFEEIHNIENQMRKLEDKMKTLEVDALEKSLGKYSDLVQLYEVKDGYNIEEKLSKVCTGLKFDDSFLNKDFSLLSGGEKNTVVIGKLLIDNPDILLLDEPTNHLDIDSIETFEEALEDFKGTIFFISHDRYFINKIGERVIAVENNGFKSYPGNYDYYKSVKDELSQQVAKEPAEKIIKVKKPKNVDENKKREAEKTKFETKLESLENEIRELDIAMADERLDYEELNELYCRQLDKTNCFFIYFKYIICRKIYIFT